MLSTALWTVSGRLRRTPLLLPCGILVLAFMLIIIERFALERNVQLEVFLVIILTSMLPLAYVDAQLAKSNDPMVIFRKFALKVLFMHTCCLAIRAAGQAFVLKDVHLFFVKLNALGFIAACSGVVVGFRKQLLTICESRDVLLMFIFAFGTAVATCVVFGTSEADSFFDAVSIARYTSDYLEVLAFVPAAWTTFSLGMKDEFARQIEEIDAELDLNEYKSNALAFNLPIVGFYFVEDIVTGCFKMAASPFEAMAHILHFLLLVDLGVFVVTSAFDDSNQSRGTLLTRFGDNLFPDMA